MIDLVKSPLTNNYPNIFKKKKTDAAFYFFAFASK
jgi:hypothetical protein